MFLLPKELVGSLSRTGRSRCRLPPSPEGLWRDQPSHEAMAWQARRRDRHHGSRYAADPALVPQKARALRAWHEQSTVDRARATCKARCLARQRGFQAGTCAGFVGGKIASPIFMTTVQAHFLRGRPGGRRGSINRGRDSDTTGTLAGRLLFSLAAAMTTWGLEEAGNDRLHDRSRLRVG